MKEIRDRLFALQDKKYRDFQCKLMPTVSPACVIGVRTPQLRRLAKELAGTPEAEAFMLELPHQYYEENNLHAFLLEGIKDFEACIEALNTFLPYVDNWATCDSMSPKACRKHLPALREQIQAWMASPEVYTCRFGIGMLMRYYLDEAFSPEYLEWVASVHSKEYYINMMIAWYFATALAKQYESTLPYLCEERLPVWVHNKTIQKAVESYRITAEQKQFLRQLKRNL